MGYSPRGRKESDMAERLTRLYAMKGDKDAVRG